MIGYLTKAESYILAREGDDTLTCRVAGFVVRSAATALSPTAQIARARQSAGIRVFCAYCFYICYVIHVVKL